MTYNLQDDIYPLIGLCWFCHLYFLYEGRFKNYCSLACLERGERFHEKPIESPAVTPDLTG